MCACGYENPCPSEERGLRCWLCPECCRVGGKPLPEAGGWVPSLLLLLLADLRGNKKGSERLAGVYLPVSWGKGVSSHTPSLVLSQAQLGVK